MLRVINGHSRCRGSSMIIRLDVAVLAALSLALLTWPAGAGCVIAPDGKSISAVTDNGSSDEKTCAVSCKVDTKIGEVQVACGGTTPPRGYFSDFKTRRTLLI
jgi:hypothetical protein